MRAQTTTFTDKASGRRYWVEYRTGFRGREFNAGVGWRGTLHDARVAAEAAGELREVTSVPETGPSEGKAS